MKVCDILKEEYIIHNMVASNKSEAINQLVDLLKNNAAVSDIEIVRKAVFEREGVMSTGVGKGFAIPHGKTSGVNDIIGAFALVKNPLEFESMDGEPVRLIFLLAAKDTMVNMHIKLLSRISRLMGKDDFRQHLLESNSAAEIAALFKHEEEQYPEI